MKTVIFGLVLFMFGLVWAEEESLTLRQKLLDALESEKPSKKYPTSQYCKLPQTSTRGKITCPKGMALGCKSLICYSKKLPKILDRQCSMFCNLNGATTLADAKCQGYFTENSDLTGPRIKIQDMDLCYDSSRYQRIGREDVLIKDFCKPWGLLNGVYRKCPKGNKEYCKSASLAPICAPKSISPSAIQCTYTCQDPGNPAAPLCSGAATVSGERVPLKNLNAC